MMMGRFPNEGTNKSQAGVAKGKNKPTDAMLIRPWFQDGFNSKKVVARRYFVHEIFERTGFQEGVHARDGVF